MGGWLGLLLRVTHRVKGDRCGEGGRRLQIRCTCKEAKVLGVWCSYRV